LDKINGQKVRQMQLKKAKGEPRTTKQKLFETLYFAPGFIPGIKRVKIEKWCVRCS